MIKKITYTLTTIALIIHFGSCDKIEENNFLQTTDTTITNGNNTFVKKIVIEDFTGHTCSNCPLAAEELHTIQNVYPQKVIGIAIHSGGFATPQSNTSDFTADYTCTEGDDIYSNFDVSSNPIGMINRTGLLAYSNWIEKATEQLAMEANIGILLSEENEIVKVQAKKLSVIDDEISLVVCITEDNIISGQLTSNGVNSQYEHNHVLRKHLNGTWGEIVNLNYSELETFTFDLNIDANWIRENCNVIAYIYNNSTMEILQAEEIYLN